MDRPHGQARSARQQLAQLGHTRRRGRAACCRPRRRCSITQHHPLPQKTLSHGYVSEIDSAIPALQSAAEAHGQSGGAQRVEVDRKDIGGCAHRLQRVLEGPTTIWQHHSFPETAVL
jgi:hypothetical protein